MENNANKISINIIKSEMNGNPFNKKIKLNKNFKFGLYDNEGGIIISNIKDKILFDNDFYKYENNYYHVNKGAVGHKNVSYVVIKESSLKQLINNLYNNILITILISYILLLIISFYLAKLFISPIQKHREKLNNFIKDTTHELNTPISSLILCSEENDFYTEENRDNIEISVKKISNIYNDLTYLFLKDKNKENIKTEKKIEISTILEKEIKYYSKLSLKKKIKLSYNIEETYFNIYAEDFSRIINNLINNSIKYTKRKGKVEITLKNNILTIKDNGNGIEKKELKKIFDRYYRATTEVGGFGIGLNIVKELCMENNIKINVESVYKEGTIFKLEFIENNI